MVSINAQDGPLQLAKNLDAGEKIFDARVTEPEDVLKAIDDGVIKNVRERGVDAFIILPETQMVFEYGMKILLYQGTYMMISTPAKGFHVSLAFCPDLGLGYWRCSMLLQRKT